MAAPRKSTLTGTFSWSNGELFAGYVLIGTGMPVTPGANPTAYTSLKRFELGYNQRLPQWWLIPIVEGIIDPGSKLYYNADLEPPTSKYYAWWIDAAGKIISGPSIGFTCTTSSTAVPTALLSIPDSPTNPPVPGAVAVPAVDSQIAFVDAEVPTGTIDGVNRTFTLAYTPEPPGSLQYYLNGVLLQPATDYTLAGRTLTIAEKYTPQVGYAHFAYYRMVS